MIWSLSDAMAKSPDEWENGYVLPGARPAMAYTVLAPEAYAQIKNLIEKTVATFQRKIHSRPKRQRRDSTRFSSRGGLPTGRS